MAWLFNAVGDRISFGDTAFTDGLSAISYCVEYTPGDPIVGGRIVGKWDGVGGGPFVLLVTDDGAVIAVFHTDGGYQQAHTADGVITPGEAHRIYVGWHAANTVDSPTLLNVVRVDVNGVNKSLIYDFDQPQTNPLQNDTSPLLYGDVGGTAEMDLAPVVVWNHELSTENRALAGDLQQNLSGIDAGTRIWDTPMSDDPPVDTISGTITGTATGATFIPVDPAEYEYEDSPIAAVQGVSIGNVDPTLTGGSAATSWAVTTGVKPAWLSLILNGPNLGRFTGTPVQGSTGALVLGLTPTNAAGPGDEVFVTFNVANPAAPTISFAGSPYQAYCGVSVGSDLGATLGGGGAATCTIDPALPDGLAINATTGNVTGTPTRAGWAYQRIYTVTRESDGGSAEAELDLEVAFKLGPHCTNGDGSDDCVYILSQFVEEGEPDPEARYAVPVRTLTGAVLVRANG